MVAFGKTLSIVQLEISKSNEMYLQCSTFCLMMTLEITHSKKTSTLIEQ